MLCLHCLTIYKLLWIARYLLPKQLVRLVQLVFSAAFDRISHCGLLYKLRSISVGEQFLPIVLEFHSDRRQRVRLEVKS